MRKHKVQTMLNDEQSARFTEMRGKINKSQAVRNAIVGYLHWYDMYNKAMEQYTREADKSEELLVRNRKLHNRVLEVQNIEYEKENAVKLLNIQKERCEELRTAGEVLKETVRKQSSTLYIKEGLNWFFIIVIIILSFFIWF